MVRHYSKNDPGLPFMLVQGGGLTGFQNLKKILLACLVTGYGTKAAAGWSLVAEGPAYLVLSNGPKSGYIGLTFQGATRVYLAQTFLGMSGNFMTGEGLKTGFSANNSLIQAIGIYYPFQALAATEWSVLADAKTFTIACNGMSSHPTALEEQSQYTCMSLYAGEDSAGNFISVGGQSLSDPYDTSAADLFDHRGMTCLKDPSTGLLVGTSGSLSGVVVPGLLLSLGQVVRPAIGCFPEEIELSRAYWGKHSSLAVGYLRGVALPSTPAMPCASAHAAFGRVGLKTNQAHIPFDLGDGFTYILPHMSSMGISSTRFLTTNPRFW